MSRLGHTQLSTNVAASALAFTVAVVIGFIMPRLIYESVGQIPLGLWDLGWSFLIYISFSGAGFGPAIGYFSANFRASAEAHRVATFCATGLWCQLLFALLLAVLFVGGFYLIAAEATQLDDTNSALLNQIGFYLGISVGLVILGDYAQGLLLGAHKARVSEMISIWHDVGLAIAMVGVLLAGHGIAGLAIVTAIMRFAAESVRFTYAVKHCREFNLHPDLFDYDAARQLVRYGVKTSAALLQELLVLQAARLMLFFSAGPMALAAFSRYTTLARQINRIVDRLSISVPTIASGYHAEGNPQAVRDLYVSSTRAGMLLILPFLCVFAVFGDEIVGLWMGTEFVVADVASLLAAAGLLHANYAISVRTLSGINAHGRITLFCVALSALAMLLVLQITFPITQIEAAGVIMLVSVFAVQLPYIMFTGFKLGTSTYALLARACAKPALVNALFCCALLWARSLWDAGLLIWTATVCASACVALLTVYWQFVLSDANKQAIRNLRHIDMRPAS